MEVPVIVGPLLNSIPLFIVSSFGIVLAVLMLRRDRSTTAQFFLIAACLLLVNSLASPILALMAQNWANEGVEKFIWKYSAVSYAFTTMGVLGLVLLLFAFWKLLVTGRSE